MFLFFFVGKGLVCIFVHFCFSLDHFGFVLLVLLGLFFFSNEPRDWLGRMSPTYLCRVGLKTIVRSLPHIVWIFLLFVFSS